VTGAEMERGERLAPHAPEPTGIIDYATTTDHKKIGLLYIFSGLGFFLLSGLLSLLMRAELTEPGLQLMDRSTYNQLFTMHGTGMIFFFAAPVAIGLANYFIPLQIGAPDVAFPRVNAFSYWLFLFGGLTLYSSFFASGGPPKTGWTIYAPLSERLGGSGVDLLILSLHILSISSLIGAINFVVTIHRLRAPGMSWMRVPLFVWSIEVYAALLIAVLPALSAGLTLLLLDRQAGTHFFDPEGGGNAVLFQHVFWFFGHQ
jgi:cytochrome c oxidase subunit 1